MSCYRRSIDVFPRNLHIEKVLLWETEVSDSKVLVVDDNEDTRHMIKLLLEVYGYKVVEAEDGEAATLLAKKERPQLILMDLMMPDMDGFVATKQIRRIKEMSNTPIIALSAYVHDLDIQRRAIKAGANECLQKPNDIRRLKTVVKKYMQTLRDV